MPNSRRAPQRPRRTTDVDLHAHTTASDGALGPLALVELARARGLRTIAVTDHDSTESVEECRRLGSTLGVGVIAGVELTATHGDQDIHVLGYYVDVGSPLWQGFLREQRRRREERAESIVTKLASLGASIDMERVRQEAGTGAIGRPHIARALVAAGHVQSPSEAFARWLGRDKVAYISRATPTAEDAVRLVGRFGGVAAIAHPAGLFGLEALVGRLADAGLAGLECYYSGYRAGVTSALVTLARRYGLVPTGGSDFHDERTRGQRQLGGVYVPPETPSLLLARTRTGTLVAPPARATA